MTRDTPRVTLDTLLVTWRAGARERRAARRHSARIAQERVGALAVPPGALGRLGELVVDLARARAGPPVEPHHAEVLVLAADHGLHGRGVTPWPQDLSGTIAAAIARGRGAVNAMARAADARVVVVDAGLIGALTDAGAAGRDPASPRDAVDAPRSTETGGDAQPPALVLDRHVVRGTRDPLTSPDGRAMSDEEVARAITTGARLARERIAAGVDLIALGDVGLANTTTSAAIVAAMTGADATAVTGRGSGVDDATLAHKIQVVSQLLHPWSTPPHTRTEPADDATGDEVDPSERALHVLARLGGAEHAMGVGVLCEATARRVPVVLDGLIGVATALLAASLVDDVPGGLLAGHRSPEPGAHRALDALGLVPVLDLGMRVGEGTGALAALPAIRAAARLAHEVLPLDELLAARETTWPGGGQDPGS